MPDQETLPRLAVKDAGPDYSDGIMVALRVPPETAATLVVADGLPAEDLHLTLAYLGDVTEVGDPSTSLSTLLNVVAAVAAQYSPIRGWLSGVGRFSGDDGQDVCYLSYDAPDLGWLRGHLIAALTQAGLPVSTSHGFTPHVTLSYLDPSADLPLRRADRVELVFDEVTVMWGKTAVPVPLAPDQEAGDAGGVRAEEIADPRSWAELRAARTARQDPAEGKGFFEESAHPRGPGGKFAAKPKDQQQEGELPPDWLDRLLAGDSAYVKPAGGRRGAGPHAARDLARRRRSTSLDRQQARVERSRRAKERRDRELLAELQRRAAFQGAADREKAAEDARRTAAAARIGAEPDPTRKAAAEQVERQRQKRWRATQGAARRQEGARRRGWEIRRRQAAAAQAVANARTREADLVTARAEEQQRIAAEDADRAARQKAKG